MPRTTLNIDHDALQLARKFGRQHRRSLGDAVGELVRRGARRPLVTDDAAGFHVVRLPAESPRVTSAQVEALEREEP